MRHVLSGLLRDFQAAHSRPLPAAVVMRDDRPMVDCPDMDEMSDLGSVDLDGLLESEVQF